MEANDKNKSNYCDNLINELSRVKRELEELKDDHSIAKVLKSVNKKRSKAQCRLEDLFNEQDHKKDKVYHYLLIEDYFNTIGYELSIEQVKQKFPETALQNSICGLQTEITKYYERFKMYFSNPTLNKAIGKIKNNPKNKDYLIRELVIKNFNEKVDLKSLKNAISDLKTNRAFEKYSTLSEKAGKGKLDKLEGNQINKAVPKKRNNK